VKAFYYGCDLLNSAAQVWFVLQIISGMFEPKVQGKRFYIGQAVVASAVVLQKWIDVLLWQFLFSNNMMMAMAFSMAIGMLLLYNCKFWDAFCLSIMGFAGLALADFFIQTCAYLFLDELGRQRELFLSVSIERGLYLLLFAVLLMPTGRVLKEWLARNRLEVMQYRKQEYILLIPLLACTIYFQRIYLQMASGELLGHWFLFLLCCAMMLLFFWLSIIKHRAESESQIKQVKIEMLEENYNMLKEIYAEKAVLVHDMKNHLRIIFEMIEIGHDQEATDYISRITGILRHGEKIVWSQHEAVDLVLNMKLQEARSARITVSCKCEDMRGLTLNFVEICALFSNLLDNAIEANEKIPIETVRKIDMSCARRDNMLVVSVQNPVEEDMKGTKKQLLKTTKQDKKHHGFGIPSIQNVVESHGGYMNVEMRDQTFRTVVYLSAFDS